MVTFVFEKTLFSLPFVGIQVECSSPDQAERVSSRKAFQSSPSKQVPASTPKLRIFIIEDRDFDLTLPLILEVEPMALGIF